MNLTVGSTSSYSSSTSASSNKGFSGMASGVDTESMVEALLSGTQSKIDKQNGKLQQTEWKQEIYRSLISKINTFQTKFFDRSSGIMNSAFFNSMSSVSSNPALRVSGSSSALTGDMKVQIAQLASSAKLTGSGTVTGGKLSGELDESQLSGEVVFDVTRADGSVSQVKVDLSNLPKDSDGKVQDGEVAKAINKAVEDAGMNATHLVAAENGGTLTLTGNVRVSSQSSALGMQMLGLAENTASTKDAKGNLTLSGQLDLEPEININVTLDGNKKKIALSTKDGKLDLDAFQKELDKAFGQGQVKVQQDGGKISLKTTDAGRRVSVTDGDNGVGLKALGMLNGQSDKLTGNIPLKDIGFGVALQGDHFSFSINGAEFSFDSSVTINDVLAKVNSGVGDNGVSAGVKITYDEYQNKFVMESSSTGKGHNIQITEKEGNLLGAMFGVESKFSQISSQRLTNEKIKLSDASKLKDFKSGSFSITVDGKEYTLSVPAKDSGSAYTADELVKELNTQLFNKLGYTQDGSGPKVQLEKDANGDINLISGKGVAVEFGKASEGSLNQMLGLDEKVNNFLSEDNLGEATLKDLGLGQSDMKLKDLLANSKGAVELKDGRLVFQDTRGLGLGQDMTNAIKEAKTALFGANVRLYKEDEVGDLTQAVQDKGGSYEDGKNAIVNVNGVTTERSTNIFTISGVQLELKDVTGDYKVEYDAQGNLISNGQLKEYVKDANGNYVLDANGEKTTQADDGLATVTTTRDTDKIVEGLKSFVEEYNTLIAELNKYIHEDASYREYEPLTDAQKKEMSEKEITLWEEKAKEGLLRNDSDISALLSGMRTELYSKSDGSDLAIYDIGIDTSSSYSEYGKLTFDESKLRQMLESDPDGVRGLFTNGKDGLLERMNKVIDAAAKTSSGSPGTLVQKAGVAGKGTDKNNQLTREIESIKEKIETLKNTYEMQKTRYWRQFNSMETMMSQLGSQSSWLSQQFGM